MKRPAVTTLKELEQIAAQLAREAGEYIAATPLDTIQVRIKKTRSAARRRSQPGVERR